MLLLVLQTLSLITRCLLDEKVELNIKTTNERLRKTYQKKRN
jgi:hypothetical protein